MLVRELALLLAYAGATLGVVMVLPQITRAVRNPDLAGVSWVSWALTTLACLAWLIYGVRTGTLPQIPGNLLLVTGAATVVVIVPSQLPRRSRGAGLLVAASALVLLALAVPARDVGYLAFAIGLTSAWPQVYRSVLGLRERTASGVSIGTWAMRVASQVCWLSYAVLATDRPVEVAASTALATAVLLVGIETVRRRPARVAPARLDMV